MPFLKTLANEIHRLPVTIEQIKRQPSISFCNACVCWGRRLGRLGRLGRMMDDGREGPYAPTVGMAPARIVRALFVGTHRMCPLCHQGECREVIPAS